MYKFIQMSIYPSQRQNPFKTAHERRKTDTYPLSKKEPQKEQFHETKLNVLNQGALNSSHSLRIYMENHAITQVYMQLHIPTRYIVQNKILHESGT